MKPIIIAGTQSGVGKTTVSSAVMRALANSGMNTAPFKAGPDFIDPKFHSFVTGNSSYNLDAWMMDEKTLRYLYKKNSSGKDIAIIEGVMGLYDGLGIEGTASTAHVARILEAPVVLVLDGRAISTSIAAIVLGFRNFDRDINLKGVILNNISGERHYQLLQEIIERFTDVECLGYLPLNKEHRLESRHLGLVPVDELHDLKAKVDILAEDVNRFINIKRLKEIADEIDIDDAGFEEIIPCINGKGLRIAVARDEAFNFYYQDNLDLMSGIGMELIEFSPLRDDGLPDDINGVYLGGGFPEIFAGELSKNLSMREDIRAKAEDGMTIFAECGGLMYLTKAIEHQNARHEMAGFFDCFVRMTGRLQRFGYVEVEYDGAVTKAHEFHHSILEDIKDRDMEYAYSVKKPQGDSWQCGLSKKNVLAGYAHIHFYSNPKFTEKILQRFNRHKDDPLRDQ